MTEQSKATNDGKKELANTKSDLFEHVALKENYGILDMALKKITGSEAKHGE